MKNKELLINQSELFSKLTSGSDGERLSFEGIEKTFSEKLKELEEEKKLICVKDYFGEKMGVKASVQKLVDDKIIESRSLEKKFSKDGKFKHLDFKGLYVFYSDGKPFYVGISRSVINRIQQHTKTGKSHYAASMAYKIACVQHELNGNKGTWARNELPYKENILPIQKILQSQHVKLFPIKNDEELYLFEVYCSLVYDTLLNKFATH